MEGLPVSGIDDDEEVIGVVLVVVGRGRTGAAEAVDEIVLVVVELIVTFAISGIGFPLLI